MIRAPGRPSPTLLPTEHAVAIRKAVTMHSRTRSGRRLSLMALTAVAVGILPGISAADAVPVTYVAQGPRPINGGQTENQAPNNEVAGAVHTVVAHPTDPDILWIGTVNGGVWRTYNATALSPTWVPLTDQLPGLSIGAMEMDPTIATNSVLVAGTGRFSSFGRIGGPRVGIYRTVDGGASWEVLGNADLAGQNISGVAPRGNVIVVTGNGQGAGAAGGGLFRSTNTGVDFDQLSGDGASGLPVASFFDLVGDPSDPTVLYAASTAGLFRSDDTGATWTNVTAGVGGIGGATNNIEMAVHAAGGTNAVYVGVVNTGQLNGLFRSTDQGANWTAMDIPQTNEGGNLIGLQPREKPGAQGATHFSILADPTNATVVYLGGDRQPNPFTNSIGANDFSGRLFRCDASLALLSQCTPLTHNGTSSTSAPHADSREMVFDAQGDIIETNDGGVVRRTSPQDANGDWFSINGNLQIAESHSCAYDSVGDIITCGNQDTGAPEQISAGNLVWTTLTAGDGGFVATDDSGAASIRYSSSNSFGGATGNSFRRRVCTAANVCVNSAPGFIVAGSGGQTIHQLNLDGNGNSTLPLYTPLYLNDVDPSRFIVGTNIVYESLDQLDNLTAILTIPELDGNGNPTIVGRAAAYGGRSGGVDAPGVLWFGTAAGGALYLRTSGVGAPTRLPAWTFGTPTDVVMDPENWAHAFVSAGASVYETTDAGTTFTDITGDLADAAPNAGVRSLEVVPVPGTGELAILAGLETGVFMTNTQNPGRWAEFGADFPNTIAYHLEHDTNDDVLMVATMGRGAWLVNDVSDVIPQADLRVAKSASPDPVVIAGEELFYTVTVTNDGPDPAYGARLVDQLPPEVVYLENGKGCEYDPLDHELTCEVGDLAPGASFTVVIKTLVGSDTVVDEDDGTLAIVNSATVGSVSIDPDTTDNTVTKTSFVQDEADLQVTKVCKPDDLLPAGETGFCTVFVDNVGPSSARDVVVTDENLSDGAFTFGTITPSQGSCALPVDGLVVCDLGDLAAASTTETGRASVTIEVSATEAMDINDFATVDAATPDPDTSNNSGEGSISVMAVADLTVTKTGPAAAIAGTDISYTIEIENTGPSTAEGVIVEDDVPIGVTILAVTGSNGAGCNQGVPGNPLQPSTCSFGTLAPGASRSMTIEVRIGPDFRGPLHNDVRVSSDTFDDQLDNNLDSVTTEVTASADVSIVKSDSPDPVLAGDLLTYTLVVTNDGPSTADDVVVSDALPAGTFFVDGVDQNGTEMCAFVQPDQVVCDLGTLAVGESVTVYVTVTVDPSVPENTVLTNSAAVTSSTPDPDLGNNATSIDTLVLTEAELWLDKTGEMRSGNPAPLVVYTLTVHNDPGCETDAQSSPTPTCGAGGPSDAQGVTVVDTLPLNPTKVVVQYVSPECAYDEPSHTVTCQSGPLPAGEMVTFVIEVQINGSVRTITNTATLTADTPDSVLANNTDSVDIVVKGGTGGGGGGGGGGGNGKGPKP